MMVTMWKRLPEEVWLIIIAHTDASSRRNLCLVNKFFCNAVKAHLHSHDHWILLRAPQKLNRSLWQALKRRHSRKVVLEKSHDSSLELVLMHLSNISALKVQFNNLTYSTMNLLCCNGITTSLNDLDIEWNRTTPSALGCLNLLNTKLMKLKLRGSISGSDVTRILQGFIELNSLSLDLRLEHEGIEAWFLARTLAENIRNQLPSMKKLKNLNYSFQAYCNYEALLSSLTDTKISHTLEYLEHLSLEKAVFNSVPICFSRMASFTSLALVNCVLMNSYRSNFFEGLQYLKELTLKNLELSQDLLQDLPSSLVSLSLHTMSCTKGFYVYLKQYGKNLIHLELDAINFFHQILIESMPEICPNLQKFLFRRNYCDAGVVMNCSRLKNLQLLDVTGCIGYEKRDMTHLAKIIKANTGNKLRLIW